MILDDSSLPYEKFFETLIAYVYDNSKICRMLIKNGNRSFSDRISVFLEEKYLEIWTHEIGANNITEELIFFASYHIQGCLGIINRWAENNFAFPKEKLIGIIVKVDSSLDKLLAK